MHRPTSAAALCAARALPLLLRVPRPIWNGFISFGLVTIPVQLVPATRDRRQWPVHFLHRADRGRIHNRRVCSVDGDEVPWSEVVRGYEYDKGRFAVLTDEELEGLRPESTQTVDIVEFVALSEIDPILFERPYYLRPDKKEHRAYALLRDVLRERERVGVARVVLRTRQHLAIVKPAGAALVLELMRFADELVAPGDVGLTREKTALREPERKAALTLVDAMTRPFDASEFRDTYHDELRKLLRARAGARKPRASKRPAPRASNVIDLTELLRRSLAEGSRRKGQSSKGPRRRAS